MNFIRKVGHFIKRLVQIVIALFLILMGITFYSMAEEAQVYNESPEGKLELAEKAKAKEEAIARKLMLKKTRLAEKVKSDEEALARTLMLKKTREESAARVKALEQKHDACKGKRIKDYVRGKHYFTQSLKDPSSFDQVGFPRKFADSYEITYTATNSYGGRVQSTHSIPVTNCIYK